MKHPFASDAVQPFAAEFTLKMLRNLFVVIEATGEGGPIRVELHREGVWAVTPDGQRICIGRAGSGAGTAPPPRDA